MIEDRLLIYRFKRGSRASLSRIYQKHKAHLLRIAWSLLNDKAAAEDVVHDCFVSFAQAAQRLRFDGNLKSYLATCVANRVRNINKAGHPQKCVDLYETEPLESKQKKPQQWLIETEQFMALNTALARLSYEQREVLSLHLQGGMKFRDIAELQGVSINTVQSRYRYGLEKLRTLLNGEVQL